MNPIFRLVLLTLPLLALGCVTKRSASFETPEDAVRFLVEATDDRDSAELLLGPGGFDMLRSGDDVADRQDLEAVVELMREKIAFEDLGEGRRIALLGNDGWELPIPLVEDENGWRFDVEAGREEIVNRRVGRNEISTIETLRAMVDAQREYAAEGRDGNPPAFARRFLSSPGRHDGLYWPASEHEEESPLGPLIAEAAEDGYRNGLDQPIPYHGYFYRLLTAQGSAAPGGARSYVDAQDRLTRGFAVVAWPATYGNSGVMTFLVNQQGIVFQRDLGAGTAQGVAAIRAYDPDANWTPVVE
jgi:hypothetical protein